MQIRGIGMKYDGTFSANLLSLQLQLKTLLEDAGGDRLVGLLDSLCKLNPAEQELVLASMTRLIERIVKGDVRLSTIEDIELKKFEESLYDDIISSISEAANSEGVKRGGLALVMGGKDKKQSSKEPIDLAEARKLRKAMAENPVLN